MKVGGETERSRIEYKPSAPAGTMLGVGALGRLDVPKNGWPTTAISPAAATPVIPTSIWLMPQVSATSNPVPAGRRLRTSSSEGAVSAFRTVSAVKSAAPPPTPAK